MWTATENAFLESETVVVGPKYLPELSRLPESSLSVLDAIDEVIDTLPTYTWNLSMLLT